MPTQTTNLYLLEELEDPKPLAVACGARFGTREDVMSTTVETAALQRGSTRHLKEVR